VGLDGQRYEARQQPNGRMRWYVLKESKQENEDKSQYNKPNLFVHNNNNNKKHPSNNNNNNHYVMEVEVLHVIHTNYNAKTSVR
jgi:hypothetical protein